MKTLLTKLTSIKQAVPSKERYLTMKVSNSAKQNLKLVFFVSFFTFLVGCAVKTDPLSDDERRQRASDDLASMFQGQESLSGPITLGEAIARALKYNLDHRLKMMENALAVRKYKFDKTGMLPRLVARAGYSDRNNNPGARSIDINTGEESLPASVSQDQERETSDLTLTWNILDFGLSYYTAKQSSNEILIAEERQRKTIQNITQDVIDAFWKAWMAQTLEPKIDSLLAETTDALDRSRDLVKRGVQNSNEALASQGGLLNTMSTLNEMRERINLGKIRLAALINVSPGTDFQVSPPVALDIPARLADSVAELSQKAILNRPELREEDYRLRVTELDAKKAMLKIFPNLNLSAGYYRDENSFLVNRDWEEAGLDLSWNLLGIFNAVAEKKFHEAAADVADARRVALSMAVMTQVYLAVSRYELARSRFSTVSDLYQINAQLARNNTAKGSRASGMQELDGRATALATELRRNLAFAETQAAFARVLNSAGIDPVPDSVESLEISSLKDAFDGRWSELIKGNLQNY